MGIMLVFSVLIRVRVQDLKRGVWDRGFVVERLRTW